VPWRAVAVEQQAHGLGFRPSRPLTTQPFAQGLGAEHRERWSSGTPPAVVLLQRSRRGWRGNMEGRPSRKSTLDGKQIRSSRFGLESKSGVIRSRQPHQVSLISSGKFNADDVTTGIKIKRTGLSVTFG